MKDKEFITLCRALDLNPGDGIIYTKYEDTEHEYTAVIQEVKYDSETKVAYLKSVKGVVVLASAIATLERNNRLKAAIKEK